MPRVVSSIDAKEREKLRVKSASEKMLEIVDEYKHDKEDELLKSIIRQPVGDLLEPQMKYKACMDLISWLKAKIIAGKKVEDKVKKESK